MDIKAVVFFFLYNDPLMLWTEFRKLLVIAQQIEGIYGALENNGSFYWHRSGDKPFSEPVMAYFNNAWMRQSASMSWNNILHHATYISFTNNYIFSLPSNQYLGTLTIVDTISVTAIIDFWGPFY